MEKTIKEAFFENGEIVVKDVESYSDGVEYKYVRTEFGATKIKISEIQKMEVENDS